MTGKLKTWDDLERLAMGEPWSEHDRTLAFNHAATVVHQCLTMVDRGDWTRQQALIQIVFALTDLTQSQQKTIIDHLNSTVRPIVIPLPIEYR